MYQLTSNNMKKIFALFLAGFLAVVLLAACEEQPPQNNWNCWRTGAPGCPENATQSPEGGAQNTGSGNGGSGGTAEPGGGQTGGGTQSQTAIETFDLPAGWKRDSEIPQRGILYKPSSDEGKPYVMVEVYRHQEGGTNADAKKLAEKVYAKGMEICKVDECKLNVPSVTEKNIAGYTVYIGTEPGNSFGEETWYSDIFFVKNGGIYFIQLGDLLEKQEDAVRTIIETVKGG